MDRPAEHPRSVAAMHELGATPNIVAIVCEAAEGRKLRRVKLDVGELSGVKPETVAFCFKVVARGTPVEGAQLDIHRVKGFAQCRECGARFETSALDPSCACGSPNVDRLAGEERNVREMELEDAPAEKADAKAQRRRH